MMPGSGRFLRDNAFLVAAVSLPLIVVAFFLASTAIPRWTVPPPAYDLLIRATDTYNTYNQRNPPVSVDFDVRDGTVEATIRPVQTGSWGSRARLFIFDHTTMSVNEIAVDLPDTAGTLKEGDAPITIVVDALGGRRLLTQAKAPDGYELENRSQRSPGIVGDVFGMRRYGSEASLVNKGRVVPIALPAPYQNPYFSPVYALGWLVPETAGIKVGQH
jgi:hypothetical protein